MHRLYSPTDEELAPAEKLLTDAVIHALHVVCNQMADQIGHVTIAAASEPTPEQVAQAAVDAAPAGPPGQPYVSVDDLASMPSLWAAQAQQLILPLTAEIYRDSADKLHAQMVNLIGPSVPAISSQAAEDYLAAAANRWDVIGDEVWNTARAQLVEGFQQGESIPKLAARVRSSAGLSQRSATAVARTEVVAASNAGSYATAQSSQLDMVKVWLATDDERTRRTHNTADGQRKPLNQPFEVGVSTLDFPGAPGGAPAEVYNCRCVAAETPVSGLLSAAMQRPFEGDLVEITTASGHKVAATPDHPVLTSSGWRAIGAIQPGDYVLRCREPELALALGGTPHPADGQASAEEIWRTFTFAAGGSQRARGSTVNLDRESGCNEQIDVAVTKDALPFGIYAETLEHLGQFDVAISQGHVSGSRDPTALDWLAHPQITGLATATNRQIKVSQAKLDVGPGYAKSPRNSLDRIATLPRLGDAGEPVGSFPSSGIPQCIGLGSDNAAGAQLPVDGVEAPACLLADGGHGLAGLVELDPVVDRRNVSVTAGHVYDFSSPLGVFTADSIIVHNCTVTYEISDEEVRAGKARAGSTEVAQPPPAGPAPGVGNVPSPIPPGDLASLPRISGTESTSTAAKAINPHFEATAKEGMPTYRDAGRAGQRWTPEMGPLPSGAYEENCTNVVLAFEMRRRGYAIQAAPLDVLDGYGYAAGRTVTEMDQLLADAWRLPSGRPHGRTFAGQEWRSFADIDREILRDWPEGGRGFISVGKHVFNVVKERGKVVYIEAQYDINATRVVTGAYQKKFNASGSKTAKVAKLIRLDDLVPADGILQTVVVGG